MCVEQKLSPQTQKEVEIFCEALKDVKSLPIVDNKKTTSECTWRESKIHSKKSKRLRLRR